VGDSAEGSYDILIISYSLCNVTVVSNTCWFMHCFVTCDMFCKLLVFYKPLEIVIVAT